MLSRFIRLKVSGGVDLLLQAELRKEWAEKFYNYILVEKNGSRLTGENYRRDISDFEQFMSAKAGA
ncbi:MAG: site-specific integrase, partial [Acidaminococcaceae bacterium]|nr:site-specific integrase [Acidaminococcaceae bacterium]